MFRYLTQQQGLAPQQVGSTLWHDYQRGGRSDRPAVLEPYVDGFVSRHLNAGFASRTPPRQAKHLGS
jgi:hypothetical protein